MFTSLWCPRAVSKHPAARRRGRRKRLRLDLEPLEDRSLLSTYTPGPLVLLSSPDPLADCPPGILPANAAAEPYMAVNPANTKNIVAEWIDHGFAGNVAATTLDGGKTWQNVAIPGITQCTGGSEPFAADPWLSFAANGDLYSIGVGFGVNDDQFLVNKSTDGGLTWSNPIQVNTSDKSRSVDKPSITADPTNPNYVYATWVRYSHGNFNGNNSATMFARSTDGGRTWQPAQSIHSAPGTASDWGHQIVVLPDGTLIDAFTEGKWNSNNEQGALTVLRSADHGQTWSAPISAVAQEPLVDPKIWPPNALVTDPDTGNLVEAHPMLDSIAVDRHSGNLYAVWIDARFSNFQYNSIALSMSADGGFTWSQPIQVNQTPNTVPPIDRQAWNPTVAVAANGTVAVSYYDFRNNTADSGALTDYWLATAPAPATNLNNWSEVRLTDTSFNLGQAPTRFNGAFFLGDYEGLAAAGNDFVATWGMPDSSVTAQESIFFRRANSRGSGASSAAMPAEISLVPQRFTTESALAVILVGGGNGGSFLGPYMGGVLPSAEGHAATPSLGGTAGQATGFNETAIEPSAHFWNVGSDDAAINVESKTTRNVYKSRMEVDEQAPLWWAWQNGLEKQANDLFDAVHKAWAIW